MKPLTSHTVITIIEYKHRWLLRPELWLSFSGTTAQSAPDYPARTRTLQEAPSFAWRTNVLGIHELSQARRLADFLPV